MYYHIAILLNKDITLLADSGHQESSSVTRSPGSNALEFSASIVGCFTFCMLLFKLC